MDTKIKILVTTEGNMVKIWYVNPISNARTPLLIQRELVETSSKTPVAITTVWEGFSLTLYVDKKFKVRGVEKSIFLQNSDNKANCGDETPKKSTMEAGSSDFGKVLILGLSEAGKTSLITRLTSNFFAQTKPTLGVNIMKAVLEHTKFVFYDVGGQKAIRSKWTTAVPNPDAIVFVFDVNSSPDQVEEAREEFKRVVTHFIIESKLSIPVLILGNKIDVMAAQNIAKDSIMTVLLSLFGPDQYSLNYRVGLVSALTGEGINYNFKWLIATNILI